MRDADAGRDRQLAPDLVAHVVGLAQHVEHPLRDELRSDVERRAVEQHDELVAGEARGGVASRITRSSRPATILQELVPGGVAERVVDVLEAVDVDVQGGDRHLRAPCPREHLLGPVERERAVGKPGERVVQRLMAQLNRLLLEQRERSGSRPSHDRDQQEQDQRDERADREHEHALLRRRQVGRQRAATGSRPSTAR